MSVRLFHGDCQDILPTLEDVSVDAIITDVPYGTTACKWDVVIPLHDFLTIQGKDYQHDDAVDRLVHFGFRLEEAEEKWSKEHKLGMWSQVKRLCKGAFVTTASQPFTSVLVTSALDMFRYEWIWDKKMASGFMAAKFRPLMAHQNVLVFSANGHTYNPQKVERTEAELKRLSYKTKVSSSKTDHARHLKLWSANRYENTVKHPSTLIRITGIMGSSNEKQDGQHPTQKPVALYEYLVKTYTNEGDTVLDFCMGSGTTGVACMNTGRNFIGVEKERNYFEIAERRIRQAQEARQLELVA